MHKTIYDISAKRAQYKIENHTHKKDIYNKKKRKKQANKPKTTGAISESNKFSQFYGNVRKQTLDHDSINKKVQKQSSRGVL